MNLSIELVITLLVSLVPAAVAWGSLLSRMSALEQRHKDQADVNKLTTERLQNLQLTVSHIDKNIAVTLVRLEQYSGVKFGSPTTNPNAEP